MVASFDFKTELGETPSAPISITPEDLTILGGPLGSRLSQTLRCT